MLFRNQPKTYTILCSNERHKIHIFKNGAVKFEDHGFCGPAALLKQQGRPCRCQYVAAHFVKQEALNPDDEVFTGELGTFLRERATKRANEDYQRRTGRYAFMQPHDPLETPFKDRALIRLQEHAVTVIQRLAGLDAQRYYSRDVFNLSRFPDRKSTSLKARRGGRFVLYLDLKTWGPVWALLQGTCGGFFVTELLLWKHPFLKVKAIRTAYNDCPHIEEAILKLERGTWSFFRWVVDHKKDPNKRIHGRRYKTYPRAKEKPGEKLVLQDQKTCHWIYVHERGGIRFLNHPGSSSKHLAGESEIMEQEYQCGCHEVAKYLQDKKSSAIPLRRRRYSTYKSAANRTGMSVELQQLLNEMRIRRDHREGHKQFPGRVDDIDSVIYEAVPIQDRLLNTIESKMVEALRKHKVARKRAFDVHFTHAPKGHYSFKLSNNYGTPTCELETNYQQWLRVWAMCRGVVSGRFVVAVAKRPSPDGSYTVSVLDETYDEKKYRVTSVESAVTQMVRQADGTWALREPLTATTAEISLGPPF